MFDKGHKGFAFSFIQLVNGADEITSRGYQLIGDVFLFHAKLK